MEVLGYREMVVTFFFSLAYLVCVSVGDSDSGSGKPVAQRFSFISAYYTEKLVYLGDDFGRN
jgi:hypothetical protein